MEINYRGGNCVTFAVKKETLVVDGGLSSVGLSDVTFKDGVYLATQAGFNPKKFEGMTIDSPGEYEIRGVSVKGVGAPRMIDADDTQNSTIYQIMFDGISIVVVGHVRVPLSDVEVEKIGLVDVVIVPVGGGGYTLDARQAAAVIRQLEPKVVIPTHFADPEIKYEVPQNSLSDFISEMGHEHQTVESFKIKNGLLPTVLTVVEITRS